MGTLSKILIFYLYFYIMSLNSSHILIFQINLQLVKFLSQSCTVEAPSRTSHLISLKMFFLNLKIRGTKRLREYVYEEQTVKKRKTETEKEEKICEKKQKKKTTIFSKNYLFYYKRL